MNDTVLVLSLITTLFAVFFVIRPFLPIKVCVLCASVSTTWITLLILYWRGLFDNLLLIGVLLGGSVVGGYYLLESKVREELHVLRLPVYLTLLLGALVLVGVEVSKEVFLILGGVWIVFVGIYLYRGRSGMRTFVDRLIECCKNW